MGIGQGVVVALGLSQCKKEVRVTAAYGCPLETAEGHEVCMVTWVVRRARTSDGFYIWEARAYEPGGLQDEVRLVDLHGLSYCIASNFGTLLQVIGLLRAMGMKSLLGSQRMFSLQEDCGSLKETLRALKDMHGFFEVEPEQR